jgi:hypothetical protein
MLPSTVAVFGVSALLQQGRNPVIIKKIKLIGKWIFIIFTLSIFYAVNFLCGYAFSNPLDPANLVCGRHDATLKSLKSNGSVCDRRRHASTRTLGTPVAGHCLNPLTRTAALSLRALTLAHSSPQADAL